MKTARDEMTRQVAIVLEEDDLAQAYIAMRALEIHHVPVVRKGKLVGVLSDRDILICAREKHGNIVVPNKKVGEVMSTQPVSCHPDHEHRSRGGYDAPPQDPLPPRDQRR